MPRGSKKMPVSSKLLQDKITKLNTVLINVLFFFSVVKFMYFASSITVEMGQETEIGRQLLSADLDLDAPKHIYLMIYILQDRLNPNSFFKPYYDILPKKLSNMPIFWNTQELMNLQGSYLLTQIADRIEAIEDDYRTICEVCPQLSSIASLEDFKWARMCVCSRNFGLQIDGNRTSAMVPHADMLNHYRPRETKWTFDDDKQAFTITT